MSDNEVIVDLCRRIETIDSQVQSKVRGLEFRVQELNDYASTLEKALAATEKKLQATTDALDVAAKEEAIRCISDIRMAWDGSADDDRPAIAAIQKRNGFDVTVSFAPPGRLSSKGNLP